MSCSWSLVLKTQSCSRTIHTRSFDNNMMFDPKSFFPKIPVVLVKRCLTVPKSQAWGSYILGPRYIALHCVALHRTTDWLDENWCGSLESALSRTIPSMMAWLQADCNEGCQRHKLVMSYCHSRQPCMWAWDISGERRCK